MNVIFENRFVVQTTTKTTFEAAAAAVAMMTTTSTISDTRSVGLSMQSLRFKNKIFKGKHTHSQRVRMNDVLRMGE